MSRGSQRRAGARTRRRSTQTAAGGVGVRQCLSQFTADERDTCGHPPAGGMGHHRVPSWRRHRAVARSSALLALVLCTAATVAGGAAAASGPSTFSLGFVADSLFPVYGSALAVPSSWYTRLEQ